jgi:proteasome accessory factor C
VSNADYLARPLQLSPTEATAVIVALRALRDGAGEATREIVDRTVAKLETAVHGAADPLVDPGTGTGADVLGARFRAPLEEATAQARQVRLTYWVPSRDDVTDRVVDPRGIVTAHGLTYLDAWCHTAQAPRLFRLDRIQDAEVLDSSIQTTPEPPRDLAEGMFEHSAGTSLATLRLAPEARWVVEYYPVEEVRTRPDGSLEVDLVLADERWLRRLLLRLAPHAEVIAPAEVAQAFTAAAREAHSLYT